MVKKNTKTSIIFLLIIFLAFLLMLPAVTAADYKFVLNGSDISNVKGNYKIEGDSLVLPSPSKQEWDSTRYAIWTFKVNNPELVDRATADIEFIEESDYVHSASFFLNGLLMKEYTREKDGPGWYQGSEKILLETKLLQNSNTLTVEVPDWRTKFTVKKIIITISGDAPAITPVPTETNPPQPPPPPLDIYLKLGIAVLLTAIIFYTIEYFHKIKKI